MKYIIYNFNIKFIKISLIRVDGPFLVLTNWPATKSELSGQVNRITYQPAGLFPGNEVMFRWHVQQPFLELKDLYG